jgi:hypothetical protein
MEKAIGTVVRLIIIMKTIRNLMDVAWNHRRCKTPHYYFIFSS